MAGRKSKYFSENLNTSKSKIWSVAIYIRLSQEDNDNGEDKQESNSITSQKTLLNEFVKEHKDLSIYNTYVDDGYTGRNYIEVGNYIEQIFPLFNVRFIAINDNVDSFVNPTSTNTILVPFKNLINDEYARDTSIKIKSALNGRKKKRRVCRSLSSLWIYKKSRK